MQRESKTWEGPCPPPPPPTNSQGSFVRLKLKTFGFEWGPLQHYLALVETLFFLRVDSWIISNVFFYPICQSIFKCSLHLIDIFSVYTSAQSYLQNEYNWHHLVQVLKETWVVAWLPEYAMSRDTVRTLHLPSPQLEPLSLSNGPYGVGLVVHWVPARDDLFSRRSRVRNPSMQ